MRLLTPQEQRELEALKRSLYVADATVEIREENREMWINVLEMVLQTQEAMKAAWHRSPNPQIDFIQTGKAEK